MEKKILEVLTYIMQEIRQNSIIDIDLQLIMDLLAERGFSDNEISSTMSWLMNHSESMDRIFRGTPSETPRPIWRHLNELEKKIITPTAFSYLFHLRELQLLSDDDMEKIIERATNLQLSQVNEEDIQNLITAVVLDIENNASGGYFQFNSTQMPH